MTSRKERPILFSGSMVRALLAGTKTVTRRLVKAKHFPPEFHARCPAVGVAAALRELPVLPSPYGQPGDRLWVKETWRPRVAHSHGMDACDCADVSVTYFADGAETYFDEGSIPDEWSLPKAARRGNVTPLFMPRWASRLTLEVVSVRCERLHDITEEDAVREGIARNPVQEGSWMDYSEGTSAAGWADPRESFRSLWTSINGAESWAVNPWCWRVEFRKVEGA